MTKEFLYNKLKEAGVVSDQDIRKWIIDWKSIIEYKTGLTCPYLSKALEEENPTLPQLWEAQDQDCEYFKNLIKNIKECL